MSISSCLAIQQELGGPCFPLRSGWLRCLQINSAGDREEGRVPGLAPSKLCRGPLSRGEVRANSGLLCHTQAMGPRLVSWPQAEEGRGDLIRVRKGSLFPGRVGWAGRGDGHTLGTRQFDSSLWVGHPPEKKLFPSPNCPRAVPLHPGTSVAIWG